MMGFPLLQMKYFKVDVLFGNMNAFLLVCFFSIAHAFNEAYMLPSLFEPESLDKFSPIHLRC